MRKLYPHNRKAYQAAAQILESTEKTAAVHPTGTGKSCIAFRLCEDHPDSCACWLSPSAYIFRVQTAELKRQAGDSVPSNISFFTYAKLARMEQHKSLKIGTQQWETDADSWQQGFEHARGFFEEYGHLDVPAQHVCTDGWYRGTRDRKCRGRFSLERQELLGSIGVQREPVISRNWMHCFRLAGTSREKHGDLEIPVRYLAEDGSALGGWIMNLRARYKAGKLMEERIRQLEAIVTAWNLNRLQWETGCFRLLRYQESDCSVQSPQRYGMRTSLSWETG